MVQLFGLMHIGQIHLELFPLPLKNYGLSSAADGMPTKVIKQRCFSSFSFFDTCQLLLAHMLMIKLIPRFRIRKEFSPSQIGRGLEGFSFAMGHGSSARITCSKHTKSKRNYNLVYLWSQPSDSIKTPGLVLFCTAGPGKHIVLYCRCGKVPAKGQHCCWVPLECRVTQLFKHCSQRFKDCFPQISRLSSLFSPLRVSLT